MIEPYPWTVNEARHHIVVLKSDHITEYRNVMKHDKIKRWQCKHHVQVFVLDKTLSEMAAKERFRQRPNLWIS
jgi:hypothetical protein